MSDDDRDYLAELRGEQLAMEDDQRHCPNCRAVVTPRERYEECGACGYSEGATEALIEPAGCEAATTTTTEELLRLYRDAHDRWAEAKRDEQILFNRLVARGLTTKQIREASQRREQQ